MGRMIESIALERGHQVVCIIDSQLASCSEPEGKHIYSPDSGFGSEAFRSADVAIEFSRPDAAENNVRTALQQGVAVVCGTTGWNPEALRTLLSSENPLHPGVIWSSNYSLGVNILFAVNTYLAKMLSNLGNYSPSITEVHHVHKLDAPSGTAKTLAEQIVESSHNANTHVHIDSIREGEVPGIHEVKWDSQEDVLSLRHEAKSRRGFALGAVIAAEWLCGKHGWHTMQEVLNM